MSQIIELLKSVNYQISKELLFNYKKMNITDSEFIILIYLINQSSNIYNPKQIGNNLKLELNQVLELINSLCEKNIIKIEMKKINNIRSEIINLDSLYEKIAFTLTEVEEKNDSNLYSIFETEFGRTLSPMEFEIINGWVVRTVKCPSVQGTCSISGREQRNSAVPKWYSVTCPRQKVTVVSMSMMTCVISSLPREYRLKK